MDAPKPKSTRQFIKQYRKQTKEVKLPGINDTQRSSYSLVTKRIPKSIGKPMSMTLGSSKGNKGYTKTVKRAK